MFLNNLITSSDSLYIFPLKNVTIYFFHVLVPNFMLMLNINIHTLSMIGFKIWMQIHIPFEFYNFYSIYIICFVAHIYYLDLKIEYCNAQINNRNRLFIKEGNIKLQYLLEIVNFSIRNMKMIFNQIRYY